MNTLGGTGPVGRGGRLLLRPAPRGRPARCRCSVRSMVGLIPLFAVEVLDEEIARAAARLPEADALVPRATARTWRASIACMDADAARASTGSGCWPSRRASGWSACCATCSTRASSSRRTASARSRACHREHPYELARRTARSYRVDYEPGEVDQRAVRRQLELARAGLVPDQLPAHRGAGALPPLLRRRRSRSSARPAPAGC